MHQCAAFFVFYIHKIRLEIDRYIGLPIFFPIFKHFTIIGYRFWNRFVFVTYTLIQIITSSEMSSLYLTHPSTHTQSSEHTHTHTHTPYTHTHTHTVHSHTVVNTHTHTHRFCISVIGYINVHIIGIGYKKKSISVDHYFINKNSMFF